jgi:hypothetical protein
MKKLLALATISAASVLAVPTAQTHPARHLHSQARPAIVPQDVRDHREMKNLMALYGNPWLREATPSRSSGFAWVDYAIGLSSGLGLILILGGGLNLRQRYRHRMDTA